MTDELNKLQAALKDAEVPAPRKSARDAAITAAMQALEEENVQVRQGSGLLDRLKNTGLNVFNTLFRRRPMTTSSINLRPMLLGGASLAAVSLAILNVDHLRQVMPVPGEDRIASLEAEKPDAKRADKGAGTAKVGNELKKSEMDQGGSRRENVAQLPQASEPAAVEELQMSGDASDADINAQTAANAIGGKPKTGSDAAAPIGGNQKTFADAVQPPAPGIAAESFSSGVASAQKQKVLGYRTRAKRRSDIVQPTYQDQGRDKFDEYTPNPVKVTRTDPVSTFSIDVDTASYAFMRASLNNGVLPQANAVRTEELINYFPYDYAPPEDRSRPFATHVSVIPTPWNAETKLLHIGIKGYDLPKTEKPRANLVFLIDTSGSMNAPNKLPLLVNSFKLLLDSLSPDDTVSIVTYAGRAGTVLEPTKAGERAKILASLDRLRSRGSTAGAEGIRQAYQLAEQNYQENGVNRVILATDGDFNVGITNQDELKSYIERKRKTGVSLSVLGFGRGNYNDALMQTLAQNGNGNAAYIDNLSEARKVLAEEASATLFTIAKDVKIQIEFNPAAVSEYRLIGYETRLLKREDFNNDKIDAGEIGAGHSVTAIYELTPVGSKAALVDDLRYQHEPVEEADPSPDNEYGFLKLRYKLPDSETSTLISRAVTLADEVDRIAQAGTETRFASAVAAYGQLLRGGRYTGNYSYDDVITLAQGARGEDRFGYRAEFINLVRLAKSAAALQPLKP